MSTPESVPNPSPDPVPVAPAPVAPEPAPAPPAAPVAPKGPSLLTRALNALAWAKSPEGRKDIGAVIAAATAVYTALHRSGL